METDYQAFRKSSETSIIQQDCGRIKHEKEEKKAGNLSIAILR